MCLKTSEKKKAKSFFRQCFVLQGPFLMSLPLVKTKSLVCLHKIVVLKFSPFRYFTGKRLQILLPFFQIDFPHFFQKTLCLTQSSQNSLYPHVLSSAVSSRLSTLILFLMEVSTNISLFSLNSVPFAQKILPKIDIYQVFYGTFLLQILVSFSYILSNLVKYVRQLKGKCRYRCMLI